MKCIVFEVYFLEMPVIAPHLFQLIKRKLKQVQGKDL